MRKIFIGPHSLGYFSAFQAASNVPLFKKYTPEMQFNTWFYTSLLQTGGKYIELLDDPMDIMGKSELIKERIIPANKGNYQKLSERVHKVIQKHTRQDILAKKKPNTLELFLTDLLYSANSGSDLIYSGEIPNISKYQKIVSPELYGLINQLQDNITTTDIFTPSPIGFIKKTEIRKFNDIINSDIYAEYSISQELGISSNIQNLISNIKLKAERLVASNSTLLSLYNSPTSIVNIVNLINPRFGVFSENILERKKTFSENLTIYRYKNLASDRFISQFELSMDRFSNDMLKWSKIALQKAKQRNVPKDQIIPFIKDYLTNERIRKLGK